MFVLPRDHVLALPLELSSGDGAVLRAQLETLSRHDPSMIWREVDGRIELYGSSETHLYAVADGIAAAGFALVRHGARPVLRETIAAQCVVDKTYARIVGPKGEFARVLLSFEPDEPGAGLSFRSRIMGGAVPAEYIPGVERGLNEAAGCGLLTASAAIGSVSV